MISLSGDGLYDKKEKENVVCDLLPFPSSIFTMINFKSFRFPINPLQDFWEMHGALTINAVPIYSLDNCIKRNHEAKF